MTVPPRLSHLLKLADQGPTLRAALAEEVADLLAAWPADYPAEMRGVCETLFARVMQEADADTRARLRARLKAGPRPSSPRETPGRALVRAARSGKNVGEKLSRLLDVPQPLARQILRDASGRSLAIAAKAAHLGRAEFSALALLAHPKSDRAGAYALLDAYDGVAAAEAARTLCGWRGKQAIAAE